MNFMGLTLEATTMTKVVTFNAALAISTNEAILM